MRSEVDREVLLSQRLMLERLEALAQEVQHLHRRLHGKEDRQLAEAALPLVYELVGDRPFSVSILRELAERAGDARGGAVLRLFDKLRDEDDGARGMGRALARVEGAPINGLRVVREGGGGAGVVWRISKVFCPR